MNISFQTTSKPTAKHYRFRMIGQGPVLLVLGGANQDWGGTLELLASNYTLVIPSFSWKVLQKQPNGETVVEYLEGLLGELQITRFSILAHSISSWIALSFADHFAGSITGLILANMPARALQDKEQFDQLHQALVKKNARTSQADYWYHLMENQQNELNKARTTVLSTIPFLIISGEQDRFFSGKDMDDWFRDRSIAPVVKIIRYAGHFPMKDNPWYFSALVKDFLDSRRNRLPETN